MALPPHPIAYGGMQVMVVTVIFLTLAVISLAMRLWSRRIQGAKLVFNDYAVIAGTVLSFGSTAMPFTACIVAGLGYHLVDVAPERFALFLRLFVPGQLLWAAANTCVKYSILSLYITIFPNNKKIHYICYGTAAAATCYFISVFLEGFLLCTPAAFTWDKTIPNGTCTNENIAYLVAGITNLIIDIVIVVLPMPLLMGLKMSLAKRLGIIAMFSLGILICVLSLMRVIWLWTWDLTDLTYTVVPGAIWSCLEPTLGVVNACLPAMMPAIHKIFGPGAFGFTRRGTSNGISGKSGSGLASHSHERRATLSGKENTHRDFERLDDEYPLTSIQADASSTTNKSIEDGHGGQGITVTRQWDFETQPRS